jgi:hypothetical protein
MSDKLRAIRLAEIDIEQGQAEIMISDEDQGIFHSTCRTDTRALSFENTAEIETHERLILDDENDASLKLTHRHGMLPDPAAPCNANIEAVI